MSPPQPPQVSRIPRRRVGPRPVLAGVGTMAVALSLAACGGPASRQAAPPASAGSPTITISAFAFAPASLRVTPGAQVTVVNRDDVAHTVTSVSGAFDTGDIAGGRSGRFTAPSRPGSYPYRCTIHQFMTGTLVVSSG